MVIKGRGKPGSFEWWVSIIPHINKQGLYITPEAKREIAQVLRPAAVQAVLQREGWLPREFWPSKHNSEPFPQPWWLWSRRYEVRWFNILRYWVPRVVVRQANPNLVFIVSKTTRSHRSCAAHIKQIERVWALYKRWPNSLIAQQMLIACANALRRRGRVIPPLGNKPVSLKQLAGFKNLELRRVVLEIRGVALPKKPLAQDRVGKLYSVDAFQNLLEVRCPSTGRRYLLGVPGTAEGHFDSTGHRWVPGVLNTPAKAQRWTLGLTQKDVLVAQT